MLINGSRKDPLKGLVTNSRYKLYTYESRLIYLLTCDELILPHRFFLVLTIFSGVKLNSEY